MSISMSVKWSLFDGFLSAKIGFPLISGCSFFLLTAFWAVSLVGNTISFGEGTFTIR